MTLARVNYDEGAVLSASDLNDEQSFLIGLRRRHNLGPHDWGILSGLELEAIDKQMPIRVKPGIAVDGYGRELYVPDEIILDESNFASPSGQGSLAGQWLDFWLRYRRVSVALPQHGIYACGPGQFNRWEEQTRLLVTRAPSDGQGNPRPIDPRSPPGVPQEDLNLGPQDDLPDDPNCVWPVYLGRAKFDASAVQIDLSVQRPYAVLAGAVMHSASRQPVADDPKNPSPPPPVARTQMELAPATSGKPLFAVRVADNSGKLLDRLTINQVGDVGINGHTTIVSDMLPAERTPAQPLNQADTDKLIGTLHLDQAGFPTDSAATLLRITDKLGEGRLPIEGKQKLLDEIRDILHKGSRVSLARQNEAVKIQGQSLLQQAADRLNSIVYGPLLANAQNPKAVRLSPDTWAMVDSLPKGADTASVNIRVLNQYLGADTPGGCLPDKARALVVGILPQPPKAALPWRLYRIVNTAQDQTPSTEMRFEILDPGKKDDPTHFQWEVGYFDDNAKQFESCLTLDAGGNVKISGTLVVEGPTVVTPPTPDPGSPNFVAQLSESWAQALAAGILASAMLKLEIGQPAKSATDNKTWGYTVKLTNQTSGNITNVAVYDIYSIAGTTHPTTLVSPGNQTIAQNGSLSIPISHTEGSDVGGKQVGLVVFAVGYGPSNTAIYGSANTLVTL